MIKVGIVELGMSKLGMDCRVVLVKVGDMSGMEV